MTLDRRQVLALGAMAGLGALRPASGEPGRGAAPATGVASDVRSLYAAATVIDACGGPGDLTGDVAPESARQTLAAIRDSGVTAVNFTIGGVGTRPSAEAFESIVRDYATWLAIAEAHPEVLAIGRDAGAVAAAKRDGRLAILFGLQDGVAFDDDLGRLPVLRDLGVRIIQPTYNRRNLLGDGCMEPDDAGLSRAGRDAVSQMNALGILVDLSHCGRRTTDEAVAASAKPVAFTHTGCDAVTPHPRNKTDAQLRALAERGGVAGIYFMPYLRAQGQQTSEDVMRHLEHAIEVAGEDHVGIGTDGEIPGIEMTPEFLAAHAADVAARRKAGIGAPGENADVFTFATDLNSNRRLERFAGMLLARGHSAARVDKVLGGNFARLLGEVWA